MKLEIKKLVSLAQTLTSELQSLTSVNDSQEVRVACSIRVECTKGGGSRGAM